MRALFIWLQQCICKICLFTLIYCYSAVILASAFVEIGSKDEVNYAHSLWQELSRLQLVGDKAKALPVIYGGARPHGTYLQLAYQNITIDKHTGFLVLKKNYSGDGITEQGVINHPSQYLQSITVMYQREEGYDPVNQNWFWMKFKPHGRLFTKSIEGKPTAMAGRMFKADSAEDSRGCIYCHASAGGGDYIFYPQIKPPVFD